VPVILAYLPVHPPPPRGRGTLPVVYPGVYQRYGFFMTDTVAFPFGKEFQ